MPSILLVEDDETSRTLIRAICESGGFDVDAVGDGFTALRMMRERAYVAALVDYHLPEMDGCALARLLREQNQERETPAKLIGITADRNGLATRRGADTLFAAILAKPLDADVLLAQLALIVDGGPAVSDAIAQLIETPSLANARQAAVAFWRQRNLPGMPAALVRPAPDEPQAREIAHCFDIVDEPDDAEMILVLDARGRAEASALHTQARYRHLPIVTLHPTLRCDADAVFRVNDPIAWSTVAAAIRAGATAEVGLPETKRLSALMRNGLSDRDMAALERLDAIAAAQREGVKTCASTGNGSARPKASVPQPAAAWRILLVGTLAPEGVKASTALELLGYNVDHVEHDVAAIGKIEFRSYDLIIVDAAVPFVNLLRSVQRLREGCGRAEVPIIIVSDTLNEGQIALLNDVGSTEILTQPPTLDNLITLVERRCRFEETPEPVGELIDLPIYRRMCDLVGHGRIKTLLETLFRQVDVCVATVANDQAAFSGAAHKLISAAGMLGLTKLSNLGRALEAAPYAHADLEPLIEVLRSTRERTDVLVRRLFDKEAA